MTDLVSAAPGIELSTAAYAGPGRPISSSSSRTKLLIVVDSREFFRDCLTSWLDNLDEEFDVIGVAEVCHSLEPGQLARASTIIISVGSRTVGEAWLERQVEWLRAQRPDVPVVAILEPGDAARGEEIMGRLFLRGLIPTSSTPEIAKAALRLIFVGGSYSPRSVCAESPLPGTAIHSAGRVDPLGPKLTPREMRVLELLMQGMANKIIAYRLGMSQSTVKVHVHNVIKKLNVRNRTEAAVSARQLLPMIAQA